MATREMLTIYVDIDGTICDVFGVAYENATPKRDVIERINGLFYDGHNIVYWTARGTGSGIDHRELTEMQLKAWGVKYCSLVFGKPVADVFIDDRAFNIDRIRDAVRHINNQSKPDASGSGV